MNRIWILFFIPFIPCILFAQNGGGDKWLKAREYMQLGQYPEAISELNKLPRSATQLYWMSYSASMLLDFSAAERYVRESISLEDNWPDSHALLGDVLQLEKKPGEALAEFEHAHRLKPGLNGLLLKMAALEVSLHHFTQAMSHYREALTYDPASSYAKLGIADVYSFEQKWNDAIREYTAVSNTEKNEEVVIDAKIGLARVLAWTKRFSEAEKNLKDLLAWKPENIKALLLLAQIQEWSGGYRDAKRTYETILKWQPDNKDAKAKLVELRWIE